MTPNSLNFVFFGTSPVAVGVLDALALNGYVPSLLVTTPDALAGRKLTLTPPPAKLWAQANGVPVLQPKKLDKEFTTHLASFSCNLFIVASYGLIIPRRVLELPKHGILNVHPSLLPKYRGPSPIQTAILNGDTETGVDMMLMDEKMDEGPILAEERVPLDGTEVNEELELQLATIGGKLLARVIPDWLAGAITPRAQEHAEATYTRKFEKSDGFIDPQLTNAARSDVTVRSDLAAVQEAERKVRALANTPGTYTVLKTKYDKEMRVKIISATIKDECLLPLRVTPEGKKEMSWDDFKRGYL